MPAFRRFPVGWTGYNVTVKPVGDMSPLPGLLGGGDFWATYMINGVGQSDVLHDGDLLANWFFPQIDFAAANNKTAVAVTIGIEAVWNHGLSLATVLAHTASICDYIVSKGMFPMINIAIHEDATLASAVVISDMVAVIETAVAHGMEFGDLTIEPGFLRNRSTNPWTATQFTNVFQAYYNGVRVACPNLAITMGIFEAGAGGLTDDDSKQFAPCCDLLAYHYYGVDTDPITHLYSIAGTAGKKFYVGEFGADAHNGSRATFISGVVSTQMTNGNCVAGVLWASCDGKVGSEYFGAFSTNGVAIADMSAFTSITDTPPTIPQPYDDPEPYAGTGNLWETWRSLENWTLFNAPTLDADHWTTITPGLGSDHDALRLLADAVKPSAQFAISDFVDAGTVTVSTAWKTVADEDIVGLFFGGYQLQFNGDGTLHVYREADVTDLDSISVSLVHDVVYTIVGRRSGASVKAAVQRPSDSKWLKHDGTWATGFQWAFNITDASPADTGKPIKFEFYSGTAGRFAYFGNVYAGPVGTPTASETSFSIAADEDHVVYPKNFTGAHATGAVVSGDGTWDETSKTYTAPSSAGSATLRFTGAIDSSETVDVAITITGDTTRPTIGSAILAADGVTITATFSEAVQDASGDLIGSEFVESGFAVAKDTDGGGGHVSLNGTWSASGTSFTATLDTPVAAGRVLWLEAIGGPVEDLAGNPLADISQGDLEITNLVGVDTTAPTVSSARTRTVRTIKVTMSEAITPTSGSTKFTLHGISGSITGWVASGSSVIITVDADILDSDTITVDYDSTGSVIKDLAGNALASFSGRPVSNLIGSGAGGADGGYFP